MEIRRAAGGLLQTNTYVLISGDDTVLIDPGCEISKIRKRLDGRRVNRIFLTHGHVFNPDNMPAAPAIDLFLYGHTHLPHITAAADNRPAVCNCGSPTFPKGGNPPTFATLDDGILRLRHLDGSIIEEKALW